MADGDRQLAFTTGPVPSSVQVSGPDRITPKTVNASFDGTSAAGPFLPCLIITGRTGHEVARITAAQVAAGASAEVSWFPRVGGASGGGGASGIQFDTDNEGGWLFVDTHAAISGISADYDGFGMALVDGNDDGIVIDSDQTVHVNTVQNGGLVVGQPGNGQPITLNGLVTLDGTFDAGGARLTNGADGVAPTDFATVEQLATTGGVTSLDTLTGALNLVPGANITISDNTPSPGDITITASGGGSGGGIGSSELVYRYTVAGADKASIDTGVDVPSAGANDWTNGDLLEVFIVMRTDAVAYNDVCAVYLNNDTANHYDWEALTAIGAGVFSGETNGTTWNAFRVHGSGGAASYPAVLDIRLPDYMGASFYKTATAHGGLTDSGGSQYVQNWSLAWRSTAAVTRLKLAALGGAKFKIGTQLLIYKRLAS